MSIPHTHRKDLEKLFASIKSPAEAKILLTDILTPREFASVAERWQIVRALAKGLPQRQIAEKLHVSISKITRGSSALRSGSGGFHHFLRKFGFRKLPSRYI